MIKQILCLFLTSIIIISCKNETKETKETKEIIPEVIEDKVQSVSNDQLSDFIGEYEFKNAANPKENLLLVLKKVDTKNIADFEGYSWEEKNEKGETVEKTLKGLFYGNTDLFDEAREGYELGFFVANVQVEPAGENSLKLNIQADASDILEDPIPTSIKSTKEALEKGNKKWQITEIDIFRELIFEIKNSNELILKSDLGVDDKIFKKVK